MIELYQVFFFSSDVSKLYNLYNIVKFTLKIYVFIFSCTKNLYDFTFHRECFILSLLNTEIVGV